MSLEVLLGQMGLTRLQRLYKFCSGIQNTQTGLWEHMLDRVWGARCLLRMNPCERKSKEVGLGSGRNQTATEA